MENKRGRNLRVRVPSVVCSCLARWLCWLWRQQLRGRQPRNPGTTTDKSAIAAITMGAQASGVQVPPPSCRRRSTRNRALRGHRDDWRHRRHQFGSSSTDESIANQVRPVASPAPVPHENLWLTVILLPCTVGERCGRGRARRTAVHFALRQIRPSDPGPSPANLQVKTA